MAQRDPFSWASDFAGTQHTRAAQEASHGQNALLQVFAQEAARQRPWSDLPVDLAKQNNAAQLTLGRQQALHDYKESTKPPPPLNKITNMIYQTAKGMGIDPVLALAIADIETGGRFDPNAKNPHSSAYGLFQQLDSNWAQYGAGLDRRNPEHQTQAGMRYMNDVIRAIEKSGAEVTPGLVYFGYQQGPGAVAKALRNPDAPVEQVLGRDAARLNGARPGQSMRSFMQKWETEGNRRYDRHKAVRSRKDESDDLAKLQFVFGDELIKLGGSDDDDDDE
jgi:soluble lytic murein transglycosylase-like protein